MGNMIASANVKRASIEAIVIRADGTRENLGTICEYVAPKPSLLVRIYKFLIGDK